MDMKNTNSLCSDFPQLYKGYFTSEEKNLMSRGFQCHDGWFEIIYNLSIQLQNLDCCQVIEATEVKQKWGLLCYRVNVQNREIDKLISDARKLSSITCEFCGDKYSKQYRCSNYLIVLCEVCVDVCVNEGRNCVLESELYES